MSNEFNARVVQSKTASYSVLVTDDQINVAPAADGVIITLPLHSALSGAMLAHKVYKIRKTSVDRYIVKIVPTSPDTINGGEDAIYLIGAGEEVVLGSSITNDWGVVSASLSGFLGITVDSGKKASISMETNAITGQINGMELSITGPGTAATPGALSLTGLRIKCFPTGTGIATSRGLFVGVFNTSLVAPVSGYYVAGEFEIGSPETTPVEVFNVISLNSRLACASTHPCSAFIALRDYSSGSGKPIGNLFSLMKSDLTWTIPASSEANKNELFCAHAAGTENVTHYLKFSVAGVSYWIHCDNVGPAAS